MWPRVEGGVAMIGGQVPWASFPWAEVDRFGLGKFATKVLAIEKLA